MSKSLQKLPHIRSLGIEGSHEIKASTLYHTVPTFNHPEKVAF